MNKKFEYVDDNPGAYFGMLVESVENKKDTKKKKINKSTKYEYLENELAKVSNDKDIEKAYDENELTIVKMGNVYYMEHCPDELVKKVKTLMKKYYPNLVYLYDIDLMDYPPQRESLKEDKKNLRNWIEKRVGKQMSSMKPTKIGYKHGRPYYSVDFIDGTSDDYFIDFDKEEIEKCESLKEDSDSNNDYLSKLKKEESELQSKITSIQQQYHYKGYMKDYKYKMASNRLKEVRQLIFKLEAESKNEKVLSKADVTRAIKKISGLETLKTTTSSVRGYRPVTGGSFKVDDGGLNNFTVYFYNNSHVRRSCRNSHVAIIR